MPSAGSVVADWIGEALVKMPVLLPERLLFVRTLVLGLAPLVLLLLSGLSCSPFPPVASPPPSVVAPNGAPLPAAPVSPSPLTPPPIPAAGAFPPASISLTQISVGQYYEKFYFCGLPENQPVICWGADGKVDTRANVPLRGQFQQVIVGQNLSCGLTANGTISCWNTSVEYREGSPPAGQFKLMTAGTHYGCALDPAGYAQCWGRNDDGRASPPADVAFTTIAAGAAHTCGLTTDGGLQCWGDNSHGQSNPLAGPFQALTSGISNTCVLRADGAALCQGDNTAGQSSPPPGAFLQIAAGENYACGIRPDSSLVCWGNWHDDLLAVPSAPFTAVSASRFGVCALRTDGSPQCWHYTPGSPEPQVIPVAVPPEMPQSPSTTGRFLWPLELFPWPSGGLALAERDGLITLCRRTPVLFCPGELAQPILDLRERVDCCADDFGLQSAALDPNFDQFPYLYVYYNARGEQHKIRLSRFPVAGGYVDSAAELVILELPMPGRWHFGGSIRFGPDGMLYLGIGDNTTSQNGQDLTTLRGKIIRIDVREASPEQPYLIPEDNPFRATPGVRPEIWAYGLRNPWRMSFDPAGRLWVGDPGERLLEEVSIAAAGDNLGWRVFEGDQCRTGEPECAALPDAVPPVVTYDRDEGCAVIWGGQYQGAALPELTGSLLFGDFCSGQVWVVEGNAAAGWQKRLIGNTGAPILSFGSDEAGELYALSVNQPILTLSRVMQAVREGENLAPGQ